MSEIENPCLTCPDICCSLKGECGLRLSKAEFEACFKEYEQGLNVREEGGIVIISTKDGLVCPNLGAKGCRIYLERPIDCRLYPYQMLPVYETRRKVKIMLYMQTSCVADRTFSVSEAQARDLIMAFGNKAYGEKEIVVQVFVDKLVPKVKNKLEAWLVKFLLQLGLIER